MKLMNQVIERPAKVLIAVESDDLKRKLQTTLCRFPSLWSVDGVEPVGIFDQYSIVSALATAVRCESDIVLYSSAVHNPELVATHFLDQRDVVFIYRQMDTCQWRPIARPNSSHLTTDVDAGSLLLQLLS